MQSLGTRSQLASRVNMLKYQNFWLPSPACLPIAWIAGIVLHAAPGALRDVSENETLSTWIEAAPLCFRVVPLRRVGVYMDSVDVCEPLSQLSKGDCIGAVMCIIVYTHIYLSIHYVCMYVCMYVRMYVRSYVFMYVRTYICIYVYMHV